MSAIPTELPGDVDKPFGAKKMYFSTIKFGVTADYKFFFERHIEVIFALSYKKTI